jgi:hypothetical protein
MLAKGVVLSRHPAFDRFPQGKKRGFTGLKPQNPGKNTEKILTVGWILGTMNYVREYAG